MPIKIVLYFCFFLLAAGCSNPKENCLYKEGEPAELYFHPSIDSNSRYWQPPPLPSLPEKSPTIYGPSFSDSIVSYSLRPINAIVNIKKNMINSKSKMNICGEVKYDWVAIEALLPNLAGKTKINLARFSSRADPELVEISISLLGADDNSEWLNAHLAYGDIIEITKESDNALNLKAFSSKANKLNNTTYLVDENFLKSLSGNPIVISCNRWPSLGEDSQRCTVDLSFPAKFWSKKLQSKFDGVGGLHVVYSFPKKHLSEWPAVLQKMNALTVSMLPDLSPEAAILK